MSKLTIASRQKMIAAHFSEVILTLSGTLDSSTVRIFEEEISAIVAKAPQRIILEIGSLSHIEGQTLQCMHNAYLAQLPHGGELIVSNRNEPPESIRLESKKLDGVQVIKVTGHLDIRGVSSIEAQFLEKFDNRNARLLVDFSAADSLSSLGIRMLAQGIKSAMARGGRTLILNPSPPIASALETAGLGHLIARGKENEIAAGLRGL